jgi:hypothetical protein
MIGLATRLKPRTACSGSISSVWCCHIAQRGDEGDVTAVGLEIVGDELHCSRNILSASNLKPSAVWWV